MYAPRIIERNLERAEQAFNIKLKRYSPEDALDLKEALDHLRKEDGSLKRPLTKTEQSFVLNECVLSKYDFKYWAERYACIAKDGAYGGGIGAPRLWESQCMILDVIAKAEDEEWAKVEQGQLSHGILLHTDKARQEGLTTIARLFTMHRVTMWQNTRAIAMSVDDKKIKNLYNADKKIYNGELEKGEYSTRAGIPWWMRPELTYDVKDEHIKFNHMSSAVQYEFSTQGSRIGQGGQFDVGHGTEMAYWPEQVLQSLLLDFFPTLPQSPSTLFLSESVAFGRSGWWYDQSKYIREKRTKKWRYCFIPWYALKGKYKETPPASWIPQDTTERHADKVWETSPEVMGRRVRLSREQMYWWEITRADYKEHERIADFLTNYSATPEEGFQHSNPTAVSYETLERIRNEAEASRPVPYVLRLNGTRTAEEDWTKGTVRTYVVGKDALVPAHPDELDHDPRGIVWMWEEPKRSAQYVIGIDPTHGIPVWSRGTRSIEDYDTDNGCIQVLRLASDPSAPDVQVAEFAAPTDQESLGEIANLLGRVYGGANEDGEALAITEEHLGLGLIVIRKMIDLGYMNHFAWQHLDKVAVTNTQSYGWYASPTAVRMLWEKFRRGLALRTLTIRSRWLVEELADCIWDRDKQTANAASGKHDDRIRAIALAQWAARNWGAPDPVSTDEVNKEAQRTSGVEWQRRAISAEDMEREMEELVDSWLDN